MKAPEPIIILTYFFPPCNLTPSERIGSWAHYLSKANYYPIIITRNWDLEIRNATTDIFRNSGQRVEVKQFDNYEVHYVPYKQNLRDKLFIALYGKSAYPIYLIVTFIWNILQLFVRSLSSTYPLEKYARSVLAKRNSKIKLIASGPPFELFGAAHHLAKSFDIQWIADYRDDWSTSEVQLSYSLPKQILKPLYKRFEKKWLSNATFFTTVSEYYVNKISQLIHRPGILIENGFSLIKPSNKPELFKKFTISYVGSLYKMQNIELFLSAYKEVIDHGFKEIQLTFIGLGAEPPIRKRIESQLAGYETYYTITKRIPKPEAFEMQLKSHFLLVVTHTNGKGMPSSKLYDYIASSKRILVCPSDHDVIEKTLTLTGQALVCNTKEAIIKQLKTNYVKYIEGTFNDSVHIPEHILRTFSREAQAKKLINALTHYT